MTTPKVSFTEFTKAADYSSGLSDLNYCYTINSSQKESLTASHIHQIGDTILTYSVVASSQGIFFRKPDAYKEYLGLRFIRKGHEVHTHKQWVSTLTDYTIGIFDLRAASIYTRKKSTESINLFIEKNYQTRVLLGASLTGRVFEASTGMGRYLLDSIFHFEEQFVNCSLDEIKVMLKHFIGQLCEWRLQQEDLTGSRTHSDLLMTATNYIRSYLWDTNLTIDQTAAHCQISVRTLQKAFQSANSSFSGCLNDLRLARAAIQLFQTTVDVTTIAFQCGFNSSAYFSKRFKEKYHLSPIHYRKKMLTLFQSDLPKNIDCPLVAYLSVD